MGDGEPGSLTSSCSSWIGRIRTLYQFLYQKENGFVGSQLKDFTPGFSGTVRGGKRATRFGVSTEADEESKRIGLNAIIMECRGQSSTKTATN